MTRPTSDGHAGETHATDADLDDLDDLRERLAAARLPEAETVRSAVPGPRRWEQGVPLADLVDVVDYWRTGYKWRSFEERLNRVGQFRTTIDGLGIHFLHRRSARADATPLILTHGWPGSVAEFIDVVDELADPEDADAPAFHVVVPSLPGFGYSDKPAITGWGTEKIAAAWVELMGRLGYGRFAAHGGDWGGNITTVPRPWAQERYRQIVRWRSPEAGGHFPSLEVPGYFVKDLREGLAAVLAAGHGRTGHGEGGAPEK